MEQVNAQVGFTPYTVAPQVEQLLEEHLGERGKFLMTTTHQETVVKLIPWITLAFMPLHLALALMLIGVTALATLVGHFAWGSAWFALANLGFSLIALPGLFARTRRGWAFFVYGQIATTAGEILDGSLFGLVVGALVLWAAFQVKRHYV